MGDVEKLCRPFDLILERMTNISSYRGRSKFVKASQQAENKASELIFYSSMAAAYLLLGIRLLC